MFRDGRHKDCLSGAQDILFGQMLPGAMGTPPPQTREYIKRMIIILELGMHESRDMWIGHPSIPPTMFGPRQYLVTPPIQETKPNLTLRPLPASSSTLKLIPKETQSDPQDHWRVKLMSGGQEFGKD